MIFGSYPCCNGDLHISMPETSGFSKEKCPHCGATVWHRMSRFDPATWTEAEFLERFEINEDTKSIVDKEARAEKEALDAMPLELRKIVETTINEVAKMAADEWLERFMYGNQSANRKPVGLEIMHKNIKRELLG